MNRSIAVGEDRRRTHPECSACVDAEGEFALARAFILSSDHAHAAKHLALGLDLDPEGSDGIAIAETLVTMLGPDAATLLSQEEPLWVGDAAAQALILHALGRNEEAVRLALQVVAAEPSKRRSAWLRVWVIEERAPITPMALTRTMFQVIQAGQRVASGDPRVPTYADLTDIALVVAERSETPTQLLTIASMVARRAGMAEAAVEFARKAWDRSPSAEHMCLIGYGLREGGDLVQALDAFVQASFADPSSLTARLDAADTLAELGRLREAADWAASAELVDPTNEAAALRASRHRQRSEAPEI